MEIFRALQSDDDNSNNFQETSTLLNTLSVNSIIFAAFFVVFEVNRRIKKIYLNRRNKKLIKSQRVPNEPPSYPLGWLVALLDASEEDLLLMVGLDAYMLLRYVLLCFR